MERVEKVKMFSKAKLNYRKHERILIARKLRREIKRLNRKWKCLVKDMLD
jgi:hypothetical protein